MILSQFGRYKIDKTCVRLVSSLEKPRGPDLPILNVPKFEILTNLRVLRDRGRIDWADSAQFKAEFEHAVNRELAWTLDGLIDEPWRHDPEDGIVIALGIVCWCDTILSESAGEKNA